MSTPSTGKHASLKRSEVLRQADDGSFEYVLDEGEAPSHEAPAEAPPEAQSTSLRDQPVLLYAGAATLLIAALVLGVVGYVLSDDGPVDEAAVAEEDLPAVPGFRPYAGGEAPSAEERSRPTPAAVVEEDEPPVADEMEPEAVEEGWNVEEQEAEIMNDPGPEPTPEELEAPVEEGEEVVPDEESYEEEAVEEEQAPDAALDNARRLPDLRSPNIPAFDGPPGRQRIPLIGDAPRVDYEERIRNLSADDVVQRFNPGPPVDEEMPLQEEEVMEEEAYPEEEYIPEEEEYYEDEEPLPEEEY